MLRNNPSDQFGKALFLCFRLMRVVGFLAVMTLGANHWLGSASAQEEGGDEAPPGTHSGTASLDYSYSLQSDACNAWQCEHRSTTESFSGSAPLKPVHGGFEGENTGTYSYTDDIRTDPAPGCPSGTRSHRAYNGPASMIVHAQCSIDNNITGGPDTGMYDSDTSVVETLLENQALHVEYEAHDCEGRRESSSSDDGAVGFGCFFYGVDFDGGGSYLSKNEITTDSSGTCNLKISLPSPQDLRIFGTVKGLIDGKSPVPISNAKVVMADFKDLEDKGLLKKLSESKPAFKKKTSTTDDEQAKYEFKFGQVCGRLPKVLVVSLLWYDGKPEFAVTNGPDPGPGGADVPVYQAVCVDDDPKSPCYKWQETADGGYEAEVDIEYGDANQWSRQYIFMESETWEAFASGLDMFRDSAYIYYNSYRAVNYFKTLSPGFPANPVMIKSHYTRNGCANRKDNAWQTSSAHPFGDLGSSLEGVDGSGGGIFICSATSAIDYPDAPVNREWHELGHYLQFQMYDPLKPCANCTDHGGFKNDNTSWAIIEGFAEFTAALINKRYGSAAPYLYPVGHSVANIELDYKSQGNLGITDDEELAVAGILWDLYDPGKEIALKQMVHGKLSDISRVYTNPVDQVALDEKLIFQVIHKGKPQTVVDLYNAFTGTYVSKVDEDMIFLDHGFFADTVTRNWVQDSTAETIPQSGNAPNRMIRESPVPTLPGSYLVADADGSFEVAITLLQGGGEHDYSYPLSMKAGVPAYFTMPPGYYPSRAVITPVSADGKVLPPVLEIRSEDYWEYIRSGPEATGVFKRIPAAND